MRRLVLLLTCAPVALALADELPAALEAARQREARLRTVSVAWKVKVFVPKGGRMDVDPVGLPLPRQDITVESTHRLVLNGDRYRSEHHDPGFRMQASVGAGDGEWAFDGVRWYQRLYQEGRDRPGHLIIELPSGPEFGGYAVRPLTLWCRGTRSEPLGGPGGGAVEVSPAQIAGNQMLEIKRVRPKAGTSSYWLDPRRDYLLRRIRSEFEETAEVWDIEYIERPGLGWVPAGWTIVKTRAGNKLVQRTRAEVTDLRVDETVPPETFRLDPQPGEFVTDYDSGKTYQVRADGGLGEIDPTGGIRAPAEPVRPILPAWPGRQLVRYVVLPALLLAVVALIVLRRRRAHTPSP
jgi:hypothetical protein